MTTRVVNGVRTTIRPDIHARFEAIRRRAEQKPVEDEPMPVYVSNGMDLARRHRGAP